MEGEQLQPTPSTSSPPDQMENPSVIALEEYTPVGPPDPKAKIKKWIKLGLVVVLILAGLNGFLYWQRKQALRRGAQIVADTEQTIAQIKARRKEQSQIKSYTNTELGFSVAYPGAWRTEECIEGGQGVMVFGLATEAQKLLHCNSEFIPVGPVAIQVSVSTEIGLQVNALMAGLDDAKKEDMFLDSKPATKVSGKTMSVEGPALPGGLSVVYVVSYSGGKIYQLGLFEVDGQLETGDFNKIVESFKFISN